MKYFLSEQRRAELTNALLDVGEHFNRIEVVTDVEDDLFEVDLALAAHVQIVIESREAENVDHAAIGLLCSLVLMEEAQERGLGEDSFPMMLQAIKQDLSGRFGMTVQ